jgi:hypothetical protein
MRAVVVEVLMHEAFLRLLALAALAVEVLVELVKPL